MAKTFCKSFKRDGSPCQGQGLEQFDGYCIAHAPADQSPRLARPRRPRTRPPPPEPTNASPNDSKSSSKR